MTCGVYALTNQLTSQQYIGGSTNIERRTYMHYLRLTNGIHPSGRLTAAFNEFGLEAFSVDVIEECAENLLAQREQYWADKLRPDYNRRILVNVNTGIVQTSEERTRISTAMQRHAAKPEERARLKAIIVEAWADPEQREARLASIRAAWTPEKRAAWSQRMKARVDSNAPSLAVIRWSQSGAKERASAAIKAAHERRGPAHTEASIRAVVEATPGWSLVSLTGFRMADTGVVLCEIHDSREKHPVRALVHKARGCKLCGYQRSSDKQKGILKSCPL